MAQAIIFDLFYTLLYDEGTGTRERALEAVKAAGIAEEDWLRGWRAAGDAATKGNPGTTRGRVRGALAEAGYTGEDEHLIDDLTGLMFGRHIPRLYRDTRETLSELRARGYRLGLLSNLFGDETRWPSEFELDRCFDAMVFSCEAGMAKPERGIYLLAAERLCVEPGECVFVDDAPSYLAGAKAVGMTTVQITRRGSEWMHSEAGPTDAAPDLSIAELRELLGWLPEQAAGRCPRPAQ